MKFLALSFLLLTSLFAQWQMFADKQDTYLYNTQTGEVYVKHKRGGENYKDVFIKMPKGIASIEELGSELSPSNASKNSQKDLQLESIKKAQEMLQKSIDTGEM